MQMRYSREKFFVQCTLRENIYTSILYYITNIRGELQLAIYCRASWQLHSKHSVFTRSTTFTYNTVAITDVGTHAHCLR